jgi:hypothetical protein
VLRWYTSMNPSCATRAACVSPCFHVAARDVAPGTLRLVSSAAMPPRPMAPPTLAAPTRCQGFPRRLSSAAVLSPHRLIAFACAARVSRRRPGGGGARGGSAARDYSGPYRYESRPERSFLPLPLLLLQAGAIARVGSIGDKHHCGIEGARLRRPGIYGAAPVRFRRPQPSVRRVLYGVSWGGR